MTSKAGISSRPQCPPGIYIDYKDLNSVLLAYTTRTLSTNLSPHLISLLFLFIGRPLSIIYFAVLEELIPLLAFGLSIQSKSTSFLQDLSDWLMDMFTASTEAVQTTLGLPVSLPWKDVFSSSVCTWLHTHLAQLRISYDKSIWELN